jgi:hypothetical protein
MLFATDEHKLTSAAVRSNEAVVVDYAVEILGEDKRWNLGHFTISICFHFSPDFFV